MSDEMKRFTTNMCTCGGSTVSISTCGTCGGLRYNDSDGRRMADLEYKVGEYEKANNYFQQRIISAGEQVKELQSRLEAAQKAIKERDQVCADAMRAHANTLSRLDAYRAVVAAALNWRAGYGIEDNERRERLLEALDKIDASEFVVERREQVIEVELCGKPSPSGLRLCDREAGHPGKHGQAFAVWDRYEGE